MGTWCHRVLSFKLWKNETVNNVLPLGHTRQPSPHHLRANKISKVHFHLNNQKPLRQKQKKMTFNLNKLPCKTRKSHAEPGPRQLLPLT